MKHNQQEVVNETADVMYHLFVLLHALDIPFSEVEKVLHNDIRKVITLKVREKISNIGK